MVATAWGLLGPETIAGTRRTRTLGLGVTVRAFNDYAVPGLGGVWFGKQLFLAIVGVAVAHRIRDSGKQVRNIEVTNAVEALACWLGLQENGWNRDPRLRGANKMRDKTDLSYACVRRPGFYVTQPMRPATVQPLRELGFVESTGERFNSFICTELGCELIERVCAEHFPYNRSVLEHIVMWAKGDHDKVSNSKPLTLALSPLYKMPKPACEFLRERLVQGSTPEASRRRNALTWVEHLRKDPPRAIGWDYRPASLDEKHWHDLHAGALFFATRDAAIQLLDRIESHIANTTERHLPLDSLFPQTILESCSQLREHAQAFLKNNHDPSPSCAASFFCRECIEQKDSRLIERLLNREGRVLRLRGRDVIPGVAFRGQIGKLDFPETGRGPEDSGAEAEIDTNIPLPEGISRRMRNLYLLNHDLRGE